MSIKVIFGRIWLASLFLALLFFSVIVFYQTRRVKDFPLGCDSFGYLSMARSIRDTRSRLGSVSWPTFRIQDPQVQTLIDFFKKSHLPSTSWDEVVAPHSYHYFPGTDQVSPQYPPGTGLILSLFEEGSAVAGLNQLTCIGLVILLIIVLQICNLNEAWLTGGFFSLSFYWMMEILMQINTDSFSINALLLPLSSSIVIGCLFTRSNFSLLFSGALFGISILIRIQVILLYPAMILLHYFKRDNDSFFSRISLYFQFGFIMSGVIPLFFHQYSTSGAWYLSTYSQNDSAHPNFSVLANNFNYYLGKGLGSCHNWLTFNLALGLLGIFFYSKRFRIYSLSQRSHRHKNEGCSISKITMIGVLAWVIPTLYFLTHSVKTSYYMVPVLLSTALFLSFLALEIEKNSKLSHYRCRSRLGFGGFFILALLPGYLTMDHVWRMKNNWPDHNENQTQNQFIVPSELLSDRAWVWSDMTSGTIGYYSNKTSFKLPFSTREMRKQIFKFVTDRNELQYIVDDSESMKAILNEVRALGGVTHDRGKIGQYHYYQLNFKMIRATN